jgi:copper oxidase (laccase) domain-containing protein
VSNLIFRKSFGPYEYEVWDDAPTYSFCEVDQVHGNHICEAREANRKLESDGIFTLEKNIVPMAIRTADCVPIVLIGSKGAAILHAGWRGIQKKIIKHPLLSKIDIHTIFLGPHISIDHYEVQKDFLVNFPDQTLYKQNENKWYFGLERALQVQSPEIKFDLSSICTFENSQFHSFRRDKTTKRNYNILKLRG